MDKKEWQSPEDLMLPPDEGRLLAKCNRALRESGLSLSAADIRALEVNRQKALVDRGLFEWKESPLAALAQLFADSPYLDARQALDTFCELQTIFYALRSEASIALPDEDLLWAMAQVFDTWAQGSVDYLSGLTLKEVLQKAKTPPTADYEREADE